MRINGTMGNRADLKKAIKQQGAAVNTTMDAVIQLHHGVDQLTQRVDALEQDRERLKGALARLRWLMVGR